MAVNFTAVSVLACFTANTIYLRLSPFQYQLEDEVFRFMQPRISEIWTPPSPPPPPMAQAAQGAGGTILMVMPT